MEKVTVGATAAQETLVGPTHRPVDEQDHVSEPEYPGAVLYAVVDCPGATVHDDVCEQGPDVVGQARVPEATQEGGVTVTVCEQVAPNHWTVS